ncbi:hypothetical protein AHAS_Ahas20G0257400 [Arachis hypogaea]
MLPHVPSIAPQPSLPSFPSIAQPLCERGSLCRAGYSATTARVSLNAAVAIRHHRVFVRSSAAPRFFLIQ